MKKLKYIAALLVSSLIFSSCARADTDDGSIKVVTSFYPIYIIAENVIGDAGGIDLENMAAPTAGCLHDYQLSTGDMKKLSKADLFIINGGGMESFLDNAVSLFPELDILDSSAGVTVLDSTDNGHDNHEGHSHEENSHFWMYPENAEVTAENICAKLSALSPENADKFRENTDAFKKAVSSLDTFDGSGVKACVFNEAFEYFALTYGMDIKYSVEMDENRTPSAKELAEIITDINEENISLLIASDDASKTIADMIARETSAEVIILDPILSGDFSPSDYTDSMNKNTRILKGSALK